MRNYKTLFFLLGIIALVGLFLKVGDAKAFGGTYTPGLGWAQMTTEPGQPSDQVRWEIYRVSNTGVVSSPNPGTINITYKKSGSADVVYNCSSGCPQNVTLTLTSGGSWTSDSYIWGSSQFGFVEDVLADTPIDASSGGRKVIKVYQTLGTSLSAWKLTDSTQPSISNGWYYNANDSNFFQTVIKPTGALVSGPGSPQGQLKSATLKIGAISVGTVYTSPQQTLPDGNTGTTLSYSGLTLTDGAKNLYGYLVFNNGTIPTQSGAFTDKLIGIDRQVPTISCQLYKMDEITPLPTKQTAESGVKVKITAADQVNMSGVGVGEIWLEKAGGGFVKVGGSGNSAQDILPGGNGNIDSMVTVDLPVTLSEINNNSNSFKIRFRARDNAYGSAGLQDHWSAWNYCGGTDTAPIVKDDTNIVVTQYKLYTDSARTNEITTSTSLEPGVGTIYGKIVVANKAQSCTESPAFKIAHYRDDSVPPNPDPGSGTADAQFTPGFQGQGRLISEGCGIPPINDTWTFEFPTPSTLGPKTSYAFADFEGVITETNDGGPPVNGVPVHGDNLVRVDYFVGSDQWFSTSGADVATAGDLRVSVDPPPAAQSAFMLIQGGNSSPSVSGSNWKLSNYKQSLHPQVGGPFASSLFNHIWPKIQDSVSGDYDTGTNGPNINDPGDRFVCDQHPGGTTIVGGNELGGEVKAWHDYKSFVIRCTDTGNNDKTWSDLTSSLSSQPSGNNVYIIGGDLTLDGNYTCCSSNKGSISLCNETPGGCLNMFIIKGDLTVNTDVSRIDGVYIVGGTFRDYNGSNTTSANKLTVNGAVYASDMDLKRKLSSGSSTTPALEVFYNPGLYKIFERVCGEDISGSRVITCYSLGGRELDWRETAP